MRCLRRRAGGKEPQSGLGGTGWEAGEAPCRGEPPQERFAYSRGNGRGTGRGGGGGVLAALCNLLNGHPTLRNLGAADDVRRDGGAYQDPDGRVPRVERLRPRRPVLRHVGASPPTPPSCHAPDRWPCCSRNKGVASWERPTALPQAAQGSPPQSPNASSSPPPPSPRTNRTRRVSHPVPIGHAASHTPY